MSLLSKVFRCLFWTGITVYFIAAAALLGLRYWVLPNIDQWRPQIEAYVSEALGTRVVIGQLKANWHRLHPRLQVTSLVMYGTDDTPVLSLPDVSAVLGWRSVVVMSPRLLSLRVDGAELSVRRDATNHLWVAGQSVDLNDHQVNDDDHSRSPLVQWLGKQRDLALVGATVHWRDELRRAPEVTLRNVTARLYNGLVNHRVALSATPPATLARELTVRGSFRQNPLHFGKPAWTGKLYARLDDAAPGQWAPWLPVPAVSGRMAAQAWLTWDTGELTDVTGDIALRDVSWRAADGPMAVRLASGRVHVQGTPGPLFAGGDAPPSGSADDAGLAVQTELAGLQTNLPELFDPPLLQADTLQIEATIHDLARPAMTVDVRRLDLANNDVDARLHGRWLAQGKTAAGTADFQGSLVRASMAAIHRYLPLTVSEDARDWLAHGLLAGQIQNASVLVQGDLDEFPFEDEGDQGQFRIAGPFRDAIVDYVPSDGPGDGWPKLENLSGNFVVDKASLALDTPGGAIAHTGAGHTLTLGAVKASIPDMEHDSTLLLEGDTSGAVPAYLALAKNYQLGHLLDGVLDEAEGSGQWQVPIKLDVPLLDADNTKVDGRIVFAGNDFRFVPQMPMLQQLRGELSFSEQGLRVEGLTTRFLDGEANISGRLESHQDTLRVSGILSASGVAQWVDNPVMRRLSGQAPYQASIGYGPGGVLDIGVSSDLKGMEIALPEPLGKLKSSALPLQVHWGAPTAGDSGKRDQLSVKVGTTIALLLDHRRGASAPYFSRGALGIGRPAMLPAGTGMVVDAALPKLDLDAWQSVADEAQGRGAAAGGGAASMTPPLQQINLKTPRLRIAGWTINDLTLAATRPHPAQWQLDLDARQVAGSLSWQEASGAIAGQVKARLKHLALGDEPDVATSMPVANGQPSGDGLSDIPAIDLQVDQFSLYGSPVGKLEIQGTNLQRGTLWRLDKLHMGNASAALDATGQWRLTGAQRGLTIDADARFNNLGAFVDQLGYPGRISGGNGSITGKLTWHDLPWSQDLSRLDGTLQISLDKGRFLSVNSRGARLLEVLSLQSLQRLAKLESNPADAWREGFPFDTIRGDLALRQGVAHSEGLKLNGPVAAIVLGGDTDIVAEQWDLKAVVIPNLDVSGAAAVTALAVNPLIGLGAFVTQWLLKQPLARAMTMEYAVTGSWNDPKLDPIEPKHESARYSAQDEYIEP